MNRFVKMGLAAALMISASTAVLAQDAGVDAGVGVDAGTNLQVKPGKAGAGAKVGLDTTITGSIDSHGSLVSRMQTGTAADLSAFASSDADVNCVMVSSLRGDANNNARAVANAAAGNVDFQSSLTSDASILTKIQTECGISDLQAAQIVWAEIGADGSYTFYIDDAA
jgi:hypothetical protein